MMRYFYAVVLITCLTGPVCSPGSTLPMEELTINGRTVKVEIAKTPEHRTQGLSDRPSLAADQGMLFVFPSPSRMSFWMIRCHFDIDVAYIDKEGEVREIITMLAQPLDTPESQLIRYPSASDQIQYALEMNGGWFKNNGITAGTRLDLKRFVAFN